jgi:hypothetical protein
MEVLTMKTYNEILKDIEKAKKALKAAEAKQDALINEIYSAGDLKSKAATRKENNTAIIKTEQKILDLKLTIKLLKNNARIALFNEITPVITETFNKYASKPYGEKTRDKISDEIKSRAGYRCYIEYRYIHSQSIAIYTGNNDYNITLGYPGNSDLKFLDDNKIQEIKPDQLQIYYIKRNYFDDIPATIKEMKKAYKKAVEQQKILELYCNEFNFFAVDGIEPIYKDKYICANLRV